MGNNQRSKEVDELYSKLKIKKNNKLKTKLNTTLNSKLNARRLKNSFR